MADTEYGRVEITTNADEYVAQTKKIEGATKGMSANLGRSALEASRAVEDLQYGIGGVVNNIPGLVAALGGGSLAMAGFSLAAVGIAQVVKHWEDIITVFETKTAIPKAADDIEGLKNELEKARDRMKELGDKSSVTLTQLEEYNALRTKTVAIEKQIADQQEKQARLARVAAIENPESAAGDAERKKALAGLGGQQKEVEAAVAESLNSKNEELRDHLQGQYNRATEQANATTGDDQKFFLQIIKETREQLAKVPTAQDRLPEAKDIVSKAMDTGDLHAFRNLEDHMIERPELFTDDQRSTVFDASPETQEKLAKIDDQDAEFERRNERAKEARLKREKADKKLLAEREAAGRRAEADPETKAEFDRLNKTFGGIGQVGVDANQAVENARKARQPDVNKAMKADRVENQPDIDEMNKARQERNQERLARQIFAGSQQATGVQFTPDQAREAAKATTEMVGQNVNFNVALNAALGSQVQAMTAMANRLAQQEAQLAQLRQGFNQVHRFMQQPGPSNLPMGR